jgi:sugar/nucleoside kinase (ribokinase family)
MTELGVDTSRVVVVGDALIDEIHRDGAVDEFVGGAALNVAIGLSKLGVPTTLIAMIGDDRDGATIRAFLREHDVALIPTIGPNGSSRGVSDRKDGEPFYVFNEAAQARRIEFGADERNALAAASLVIVSCFPFDDVAQTDELLGAIPDPRRQLIVDPNPRESMMHDVARFRDSFEQVAPLTLLVKVGSDDSEYLYGTTVEELSARLLADGTSAVLATAGARGASVETSQRISAAEPIAKLPGAVVDTMGAGDATLASVVQSIIDEGFPSSAAVWERVLRRAMLIAAATCRSEGALLRIPGQG